MSLNGSDSGNEIIFISIIKKLKPISIYFETFHRSELVNKTLKIYFNRPDSYISGFTFLGFNFARSFLTATRALVKTLKNSALVKTRGFVFVFMRNLNIV